MNDREMMMWTNDRMNVLRYLCAQAVRAQRTGEMPAGLLLRLEREGDMREELTDRQRECETRMYRDLPPIVWESGMPTPS